MENNKTKNINLYDFQFYYIKNLLDETYKFLCKLPKNRRSPKFYILEELVNNIFNSFSE